MNSLNGNKNECLKTVKVLNLLIYRMVSGLVLHVKVTFTFFCMFQKL